MSNTASKMIGTSISSIYRLFLALVPILVGGVIFVNGVLREGILPNIFFFLIGAGFVLTGILLYRINKL